MGKRGPKVGQYRQHTKRDLDVVARYQSGETLDAIGRDLGVTRERIRQILWREIGRDGAQAVHKARRSAQATIREMRLPLAQCIVCWAPMPTTYGKHRRRITCGKECWTDYQVVGYQIDPVRRALQVSRTARWMERHPERVKPHQLRYHRRVVAGEPIKSNGRWVNSERVRAILAKVMAKRALAPTEWHVEFPQVADSVSLTK